MNTSPRPTPSPGVVPWSNAVAYKAPPGPMSNPPVAVFGGVVLWFKLYSTASVQTPPAIAGGANSKTVPPKPDPNASFGPSLQGRAVKRSVIAENQTCSRRRSVGSFEIVEHGLGPGGALGWRQFKDRPAQVLGRG